LFTTKTRIYNSPRRHVEHEERHFISQGDVNLKTLAEELPLQQERCREILENVLEIGAPGEFLATMLRASLSNAEKSAAACDLAAMVIACKDLQSYSW
jgi:hypothetical protein